MSTLYPPIMPYRTGYLKVSDLHKIYYEEIGNPEGKPAVFLHGGPGAGISSAYRQLFNPEKYRVILLDQRGCGKSTPLGELRENTTWQLVSDLESLREHLDIERWLVCGGSWGGTLAVAYGETHPESISEIVLRGPHLWTPEEFDWQHKHGGANWLFPEGWQEFTSFIPESERDNIAEAYYKRVTGDDPEIRRQAARLWGKWEVCLVSLLPASHYGMDGEDAGDGIDYEGVVSLIELHYIVNKGWQKSETQFLDDLPKIGDIPVYVVVGRYDAITPPLTSWRIANALPNADFRVVEGAGHFLFEDAIAQEVISILDDLVLESS